MLEFITAIIVVVVTVVLTYFTTYDSIERSGAIKATNGVIVCVLEKNQDNSTDWVCKRKGRQ